MTLAKAVKKQSVFLLANEKLVSKGINQLDARQKLRKSETSDRADVFILAEDRGLTSKLMPCALSAQTLILERNIRKVGLHEI